MAMRYTTLIEPVALSPHVSRSEWAIVDCRFSLADTALGGAQYEQAHIPGAVYAHLDNDLSGPVTAGATGRHPLPSVERAAEVFSRLGLDAGVQVVAYDNQNGSIAGRLWWMLKWLGHDAVAVLDGGFQAWRAVGLPVRSGRETRDRRTFVARPRTELLAAAEDVDAARKDPASLVLDARAPERYRGETEPIDRLAGHIPGAVSVPFGGNLDSAGRFLPAPEIAERYRAVFGPIPAGKAICYCGSGVTAVHNILAVHHAGLGMPRLYPGSWSEWICDPARPIATGPEP